MKEFQNSFFSLISLIKKREIINYNFQNNSIIQRSYLIFNSRDFDESSVNLNNSKLINLKICSSSFFAKPHSCEREIHVQFLIEISTEIWRNIIKSINSITNVPFAKKLDEFFCRREKRYQNRCCTLQYRNENPIFTSNFWPCPISTN